jgi:hypothetical protein
MQLPINLKPLFWDCDFADLSWQLHRDFIIRRVLQRGDQHAIGWVRDLLGDDELRGWIERQRGGNLSPRQLRYWETVLDIHPGKVTRWIHKMQENPWYNRTTS